MPDWLKNAFALGYGSPELQKDLHAALFAMAAWGAIRLPQIQTFTWDQFTGDLKIVVCLGAAKFLASFVTNNQPPGPTK